MLCRLIQKRHLNSEVYIWERQIRGAYNCLQVHIERIISLKRQIKLTGKRRSVENRQAKENKGDVIMNGSPDFAIIGLSRLSISNFLISKQQKVT